MWIRFGNTLVNLDLIKEISPVRKIAVFDDHSHVWEMDTEEQEERAPTVNGFECFAWEFRIIYLVTEYDKIIRGTCEKEIHDSRDEFFLLVSDNQSDIPYIVMEEAIEVKRR